MDNLIAEKEFLSILILKPNIGIDLLQIKPKYLKDKTNQQIFESALYSKKKYGTVDISGMQEYKPTLIDSITNLLADDYLPINDIRKQYMICQKVILDNFKKQVIANLNVKLNNSEIDCDSYLNKMQKINEVVIKDETNLLTEEEINQNINTDKVNIPIKVFPKLNETLRLVQGDFLVIGANTGMGKSGFMLNLMNELMDQYQCIYFNMEMSKSTIYKRMIAIKSNLRIYDVENPITEYQTTLKNQAINSIVENKVIVEHKASYLSEIKAVLAKHKDDSKHTIVFLDHIGLIKNDTKKSIYEQTTEVAKQLRQFCLDYDCTIISACQLNRESIKSETLNLSMLKDSGEIENSSSKVILLYKNKNDISKDKFVDNMIIDIAKNRDGQIGKIPYIYDKAKQIFKEEVTYESN